MAHKVLLVGVGSIGTRHLDSLFDLSRSNNIEIDVDAKDTINSNIPLQKYLSKYFSVNILKDDGIIPKKKYKLGIFATTAEARLETLQNSILMNEINYVLLEKPLATTLEDLYKIEKLNLNDNFYVNLPREYMRDYKAIRSINSSGIKRLNYVGSKINLASNSLHLLRLIEWLSRSRISRLQLSEAFKRVRSKHPKYYEILGTLLGETESGCYFECTSLEKSGPTSITVDYRDGSIHKYIESDAFDKSTETCPNVIQLEFQSNLTAKYFMEIVGSDSLSLPKFSSASHLEKFTIPIFSEAGLVDEFGRLLIH